MLVKKLYYKVVKDFNIGDIMCRKFIHDGYVHISIFKYLGISRISRNGDLFINVIVLESKILRLGDNEIVAFTFDKDYKISFSKENL